MPIDVSGRLERAVTQPVLYLFQADAVYQQEPPTETILERSRVVVIAEDCGLVVLADAINKPSYGYIRKSVCVVVFLWYTIDKR